MAVGLAASWPGGPGLLLEADPCGGVVAARFGLAQEPGLTSLAARMRHGDLADLGPHTQGLPWGGPVVVAPGGAETSCGAVAVLAGHPGRLRDLAPVVVADVGRLHVGSPAGPLVAAADAVVVAIPPGIEHLDHADARLPALREQARWQRLGVVMAGRSPYPVAEVQGRLGVPVWGQLPRDRWGAGALTGHATTRGWARTRLGRAVRELADGVNTLVASSDVELEGVGS